MRYVYVTPSLGRPKCFQYNPAHHFKSARSNLTIELTDSYATRNEILVLLHKNANHWLTLGISRAPIEVRRTLQVRSTSYLERLLILSFQKYLAFHESIILPDVTELGAALALQYACRIQPDERSIGEVASTCLWAVLNPNQSLYPDRWHGRQTARRCSQPSLLLKNGLQVKPEVLV